MDMSGFPTDIANSPIMLNIDPSRENPYQIRIGISRIVPITRITEASFRNMATTLVWHLISLFNCSKGVFKYMGIWIEND